MINNIFKGDCLEIMNSLDDNSVDLILTDIPYNKVNRLSHGLRNFNKSDADILNFDLMKFTEECVRLSKGSIYIFCGTEQVSNIRNKLVELGLSTRLIIWEKTNPSPVNGKYIWLSGIETCVYGKKKGATFNGFCINTVLKYPIRKSKLHPTEKNLDLFKRLIEVSTNEGDLVCDPCCGSGTTAIAAFLLNRNFICFDINEKYVTIAKNRLLDIQKRKR